MLRRDRLGSVQDEGRVTSCRRILSSRLLQRPAVVGVKACGVRSVAVVRLLQGPIAHGSHVVNFWRKWFIRSFDQIVRLAAHT